jgi:cytoskeletal protein CcmA (bactofilin family)
MAIWKDQSTPKKEEITMTPELSPRKDVDARPEFSSSYSPPRRSSERELKESLIASEITIEGKITGNGNVRLAGNFSGDVHVQGNLTIEPGAKVTGGVRAATVIIGGEVEGNITDASRVELLETGVLNGDLKAGSLTVAAGSRMRGQVEFGWDDKAVQKPGLKVESGSAA